MTSIDLPITVPSGSRKPHYKHQVTTTRADGGEGYFNVLSTRFRRSIYQQPDMVHSFEAVDDDKITELTLRRLIKFLSSVFLTVLYSLYARGNACYLAILNGSLNVGWAPSFEKKKNLIAANPERDNLNSITSFILFELEHTANRKKSKQTEYHSEA